MKRLVSKISLLALLLSMLPISAPQASAASNLGFLVTPTNPYVGETITLGGSFNSVTWLDVTIDWGDDTADSNSQGGVTFVSNNGATNNITASHAYSEAGDMTIEMIVTELDQNNVPVETSYSDTITVVAPTVDAGSDLSVVLGDAVDVSADVNFVPSNAGFDWGDGDGNTLANGGVTSTPNPPTGAIIEASHTYQAAGEYTVTVSAIETSVPPLSAEDELTVTVTDVDLEITDAGWDEDNGFYYTLVNNGTTSPSEVVEVMVGIYELTGSEEEQVSTALIETFEQPNAEEGTFYVSGFEPVDGGVYEWFLVVDSGEVIAETDEDNNTFTSSMTYQAPPQSTSDMNLYVDGLTVDEATLELNFTVVNDGDESLDEGSTPDVSITYNGVLNEIAYVDRANYSDGVEYSIASTLSNFTYTDLVLDSAASLHVIEVCVDSNEEVVESNEVDNCQTYSFSTQTSGGGDQSTDTVDLEVTDAGWNETDGFYYTLVNNGTVSPSEVVEVLVSIVRAVDLETTETAYDAVLTPGSDTGTFYIADFTPEAGSDYEFRLGVDPGSLISETDETNNTLEVSITIPTSESENPEDLGQCYVDAYEVNNITYSTATSIPSTDFGVDSTETAYSLSASICPAEDGTPDYDGFLFEQLTPGKTYRFDLAFEQNEDWEDLQMGLLYNGSYVAWSGSNTSNEAFIYQVPQNETGHVLAIFGRNGAVDADGFGPYNSYELTVTEYAADLEVSNLAFSEVINDRLTLDRDLIISYTLGNVGADDIEWRDSDGNVLVDFYNTVTMTAADGSTYSVDRYARYHEEVADMYTNSGWMIDRADFNVLDYFEIDRIDPAGTYTIEVMLDAGDDIPELDESNNRISIEVEIGPNGYIRDAYVNTENNILYYTAGNNGTISFDPTVTNPEGQNRIYLNDVNAGTRTLLGVRYWNNFVWPYNVLGAGQEKLREWNLAHQTIPAGTYTIDVCFDTKNSTPELNERTSDNCASTDAFTLTETIVAQNSPDGYIRDLAVNVNFDGSDDPYLTYVVGNQGVADIDPTLYVDADGTPSGVNRAYLIDEDGNRSFLFGRRWVDDAYPAGFLTAGESRNSAWNLTRHSIAAGTYTIELCFDSRDVVLELNEANNCASVLYTFAEDIEPDPNPGPGDGGDPTGGDSDPNPTVQNENEGGGGWRPTFPDPTVDLTEDTDGGDATDGSGNGADGGDVILTEDGEPVTPEYCMAYESSFTDIGTREDNEAYEAIAYFQCMGYLHGYTPESFGPQRMIRRDEAAKVGARALGFVTTAHENVPTEVADLDFADMDGTEDSVYYINVLSTEMVDGEPILPGDEDGNFRPTEAISLEEADDLLDRLFMRDVEVTEADLTRDAFVKLMYENLMQ